MMIELPMQEDEDPVEDNKLWRVTDKGEAFLAAYRATGISVSEFCKQWDQEHA